METRSRAKAAQSQVPSEGVLEGHVSRPPTGVDEASVSWWVTGRPLLYEGANPRW